MLRLSRRSVRFMTKPFADAGRAGDEPANTTLNTVDHVREPEDRVGFAGHPRRWAVERFWWLSGSVSSCGRT